MNHFNKVAIVILTYDNLEYNKNCLDSIRKYTESGTYEIIIVDNHSTDGTREWLKAQTDIKLQLNDENVGFPKGCNLGIALASEESDILLLNNDTVVTPRWLENLQISLYSDEKIGAVGAISNHNENWQGADFYYETLDQMLPLAEKNNISDSRRWEEKLILIGYCVLVKRSVLNEIGTLDEAYSPGYVEDNDLSLRIISAGYKLMLCHDSFIHHYLGTKFRKDLDRFYPVLYANREKFKNKWGFHTAVSDEIRFAELRILNEPDKDKKINVLDVGCGLGATLLKVKYDYPNAVLHGVEPDIHIAAITKHIAQTSVKPIDTFPLDFPENYFDYIIIGNHLETVNQPDQFLLELKKYLKDGGWIIGTFQNIMHYSVIRNILSGNWLYSEKDVLNKSNRTFYTENDITTLFTRCGYRTPYIFHWFSNPTEQENLLIQSLCAVGEEKRAYMYTTYLYSIRFQK